MTRADSDPRGDIQSAPDAARGWESRCIEAPSMRMAPTPTPVARAAASAWRRVTPRRTGTGAEFRALGSRLDAHAPIQSARLISYITQI